MKYKFFTALFICAVLLFSTVSCAPRPEAAGDGLPGFLSEPDSSNGNDGEESPDSPRSEESSETNPVSDAESIRDTEESVGGDEDIAVSSLAVWSVSGTISSDSFADIDLSIPAEFKITRPGGGEKLTTTYSAYFITGTSDPSLPLYYEEEEIERQGERGVFGFLAELEPGANTFTFSQGDKSSTVTIIRKEEPKTTPIDKILQDSMFPKYRGGVKAGGAIPARCVAPSGAKVSAAFGGVAVDLLQIAPAEPGIPAVFTASLPVGMDYAGDITAKIGPVTYTLTYNGVKTVYKSDGDMYVAGKNSAIAVEVTSYAGFVYPDYTKLDNFKEKIKKGAADYAVWQNNGYFELASGGYISTEMVSVIEGKVDIENHISDTASSFESGCEEYAFYSDNFPAYHARAEDGLFLFTIYNTNGSPKPDISGSGLFSDVAADEDGGGVTYKFTINDPDRLWGYDVSFSDGALKLKFKYRPELSDTAGSPLSGFKILLDPGHGGYDNGAQGVAGTAGPAEAAINLATALAIKDRLEALGAEVRLTRESSIYMHMDARMLMIEEYDADMFLSIHHNSVREDAAANDISGMEIYYHTDLSKGLANGMMSGLASVLDRENRFVRQSYYRVTLMPYCPAVLLELGYMSNPLEYEKLTDEKQILNVAAAVAEGLRNALSPDIGIK